MQTRLLSSFLFAVILVASLVARLQHISASMPYVGHIDEQQITDPALHILQTGDFNPHTFEYPTLPTYLTAMAFTVGYFHACSKGKMRSTDQIGSIGYPYYTRSIVVYPARHLFTILSVLTILLAGILASEVSANRWGLCIAAAVLSLSTGYLYLSWKYINVDIVGAFFSTATLLYLFRRWDDHGATRAIGTGALCGLTIACKYSLYWILLPSLLAVLLCEKEERLSHCAMLLAGAVGAFLVVVPYALGDFRGFVNDVGEAIRHYATGHAGFSGNPGLAQLSYYFLQFQKEFAASGMLFAGIGAFAVIRSDWRRGIVLLAFPVAHVAYMSLQRVHFARHMAGVFVLIAVLITVGLVESSRWIAKLVASRPWWGSTAERTPRIAAATAALLFLVWIPWTNVFGAYVPITDSRKLARKWIEQNVPPGATVLIPEKLSMDARALQSTYKVVVVSLRDLDGAIRAAASPSYLLIPRFGYDSRGADYAKMAQELNQRFAAFPARPLKEFGTNVVLINYPEPVPAGDPAVTIAELSPEHP